MSRKLKTNGIYDVQCVLTGEPAGTTPQVFAERAQRYGVDVKVLQDNYIGRTGAKLLSTMVNERGAKVEDAIKQIRESFKVTLTNAIDPKVLAKITSRVTAKAAKAKKAAAFAERKAAALTKLLGATPAPAPKAETPKPDKNTATAVGPVKK